jgi:hypothetical protein
MKTNILIFLFFIIISCPVAAANTTEFHEVTDEDLDNATQVLDNISNAEIDIDLNDYPFITQITSWDSNKSRYENFENIASAPVDFWEDQIGYWFYVVVVFSTIIFTYGKSKSIEVTSMVTMLLSLLIILPSFMGMVVVPVPVLVIFYIFATLGFGAILLSLFG